MKSLALGIAAAAFAGGVAIAQTNTAAPTTATAPTTTTAPMNTTDQNNAGVAGASGDTNQAIATTSANAPMPAHGANSFTDGQAKSRLEKNGFADVSGLTKDKDGVWRGTAQRGGHSVQVWVDYKGNVGQQPA
ncbi:MAG: hypothetical protein WBQ75_08560 [Acetobacteraceae bacterium]